MTAKQDSLVACLALWIIGGVALSATASQGQFEVVQPNTEAVSAAIISNPDLVKGLAKELQSTPEQAAAAAGALFGIAKSLLAPDDFAQVAKAVPGMEALLAAAPRSTEPTATTLTPGFAASSPSFAAPSSPPSPAGMTNAAPNGATMAAPSGIGSAIGALSKIGIKPDMIMKAVPFLSGYLKKHGSAAIGGLLGSVFKTGK